MEMDLLMLFCGTGNTDIDVIFEFIFELFDFIFVRNVLLISYFESSNFFKIHCLMTNCFYISKASDKSFCSS